MSNVVEFLDAFRKRTHNRAEKTKPEPQTDAILSLTAKEFRGENLAVLVRSHLLGDCFQLVSNPQCASAYDDQYVTYLPEELEALYKLSPELIRRVHQIKRMTSGSIIGTRILADGESNTGKD